ncbi:MAG: hypothetical protein WBX03_14115 [Terriglobales bacterium]|jgi:hypothetical protein
MRAPVAHNPRQPVRPDPVQFRGHRGGMIAMHRALTHFRLGPMNVITSISLFLLFSYIWVVALPWLCEMWNRALGAGLAVLPLNARMEVADRHFGLLRLLIPYLRMEPVLPDLQTWSLTCAVTLLLFTGTFFLSKQLVPVIYLVRGILLIQATSLIYFALWPTSFPHTPEDYMEALITAEIGLISIVPLLLGFTYYIFDFGLLRKAVLTAMTMLHLAVFLPFQVLTQALVLQKTVLFMPVLYIVFGMPLNVLLIIAFYSWGMTWSFRPAGKRQPKLGVSALRGWSRRWARRLSHAIPQPTSPV